MISNHITALFINYMQVHILSSHNYLIDEAPEQENTSVSLVCSDLSQSKLIFSFESYFRTKKYHPPCHVMFNAMVDPFLLV
jgi:hypothetical protein